MPWLASRVLFETFSLERCAVLGVVELFDMHLLRSLHPLIHAYVQATLVGREEYYSFIFNLHTLSLSFLFPPPP